MGVAVAAGIAIKVKSSFRRLKVMPKRCRKAEARGTTAGRRRREESNKVACENILSCHQRCVRATVAGIAIAIATLMILHQSLRLSVSHFAASLLPRHVSQVGIVLAVIADATDAGKCGYNNLCTCNDRQQSVKELQPVPTTCDPRPNPIPSPYPSGNQNLNPNLIPNHYCSLSACATDVQ